MLTIILIISFLYVALITFFIIGYTKIESFNLNTDITKTSFSIVIPFRNEAKNLTDLLDSISKLNYPKDLFEVIFIDDESEDESVKIIENFNTKRPLDSARGDITIIENERFSNSPKKDALTLGINKSKHDWIITTDADCMLPKNWLKSFDAFIQKKDPKMIVAPVTYTNTKSFLEGFQLLDFLSLQTVTVGGFGIGKPFMCNGANLAYKKSIFKRLGGFDGNNTIASGDDLFLMEKLIALEPNSIKYLKSRDSIVSTKPQPSWKHLFNQRLRWAAKTTAYNNSFAKLVGLLVLLMNASLLIMLTLCIINEFSTIYLLSIFLLKVLVDYIAINKSALFFNQQNALKYFVLSSFVYPFFSVIVATFSTFFKYKWKGRTFKQ